MGRSIPGEGTHSKTLRWEVFGLGSAFQCVMCPVSHRVGQQTEWGGQRTKVRLLKLLPLPQHRLTLRWWNINRSIREDLPYFPTSKPTSFPAFEPTLPSFLMTADNFFLPNSLSQSIALSHLASCSSKKLSYSLFLAFHHALNPLYQKDCWIYR